VIGLREIVGGRIPEGLAREDFRVLGSTVAPAFDFIFLAGDAGESVVALRLGRDAVMTGGGEKGLEVGGSAGSGVARRIIAEDFAGFFITRGGGTEEEPETGSDEEAETGREEGPAMEDPSLGSCNC
jgi:hypothetical protein